MIFARGLLPRQRSGVVGVPEEVMEALAPILEISGTIEEVGASIHTPDIVSVEKISSFVIQRVVGVEEEITPLPVPVSETMISEPATEPLPSVLGVVAPERWSFRSQFWGSLTKRQNSLL